MPAPAPCACCRAAPRLARASGADRCLVGVVGNSYYLQGDEDMDTAEAVAQRQALKKDKRVIKSINLFWKSFQKNARMEVEREQCVATE